MKRDYSSKILKVINIILLVVSVALLLWLLNQNFPFSGKFELKMNFDKAQPALLVLKPASRLEKTGGNVAVLGSPVYFNLRTIQYYRLARIEIIYQPAGRQITEIAGKTGPGWNYYSQKPYAQVALGDGWQQVIFDFDLSRLYKIRNLMEFLIVSAGEGQSIIKEINITLSR